MASRHLPCNKDSYEATQLLNLRLLLAHTVSKIIPAYMVIATLQMAGALYVLPQKEIFKMQV